MGYRNQNRMYCNKYITMAYKVVFRVAKECGTNHSIAVFGNIPELGAWGFENALVLERVDYDKWENNINISQQKIEFKFAVVDEDNNVVEWEMLERNRNRKYKVDQSVALSMEWSNPSGKRTILTRKSTLKQKPMLSIVIKEPPQRRRINRTSIFDPFKDAEHTDSQEEDPSETLIQRRQSYCTLNKNEFLQLFYQPSRHRSNNMLTASTSSQQQLIIVSKVHPMAQKFCTRILEDSVKLCDNITWIYYESSPIKLQLPTQMSGKVQLVELNSTFLNKVSEQIMRMFEIKFDQVQEGRTICIALDIEFVQLKLNKSLNGLMLGGTELTEEQIQTYLIGKPPQHFSYVAFEDPKFNEYYLTNMMHKLKSIQSQAKGKGMEMQKQKDIEIDKESVRELQNMIKLLNSLEALEDPFFKLYETMVSEQNESKETNFERLDPQKLWKSIQGTEHRLYIFDYDILLIDKESPNSLFSKVLELEQKHQSLIIVVSEKSKEECCKELPELSESRVTLICDGGKWVKLTHEWVNIYVRHEKNVENLKRWVKSCTEKFEGSYQDLENKLVYNNPSTEVITRLATELRSIVEEEKYIRVVTTPTQLVMRWQINSNRVIDSIVQFRCMCEGSLDFLLLMISNEEKLYVVHQLERLIKSLPQLFGSSMEKYYVIRGGGLVNMVSYYVEDQDLRRLRFVE